MRKRVDFSRTREACNKVEKERKEYIKNIVFPKLKNAKYYESFYDVKELKNRDYIFEFPSIECGLISVTNNKKQIFIWESCSVDYIYNFDPKTIVPESHYYYNCAIYSKNDETNFILKKREEIPVYKSKSEAFFKNGSFISVLFILATLAIFYYFPTYSSFSKTVALSKFPISKEALVFWFFYISSCLVILYVLIRITQDYLEKIKESFEWQVKLDNEFLQDFNKKYVIIASDQSEENISEIKSIFNEEFCKKLTNISEPKLIINECRNGIIYFKCIEEKLDADKYQSIINYLLN